MYRLLFFGLLFIAMTACGGGTTTSTEAEVTTTTEAPKPTRQGIAYPSISQELMDKLATECDQLDYTFLEMPFSMSANEGAAKGSVLSFLRHISKTPAVVLPGCEKIAKIYYQSKGVIFLEADLHYFKDECKYFVFYEDGKPKYANYLTADAINYYDQIFKSVRQQGK